MYSCCGKFLIIILCGSAVSCNSNNSEDSSTKASGSIQKFNNPTIKPTGEAKCEPNKVCCDTTNQLSREANCNKTEALEKLPQGPIAHSGSSSTGSPEMGLIASNDGVYDYLSGASAPYQDAYYKANRDIVVLYQSLRESRNAAEICRLAKQSLAAIDDVHKNFIEPYSYLKEVYEQLYFVSQASELASCSKIAETLDLK